MKNYRYNLVHLNSGRAIETRIIHFEGDEQISEEEIISSIFIELLEEERQNRYNFIMENYSNDLDNSTMIREYLPKEYKQYADNLKLLKDEMSSLFEIVNKYKISDIEVAPLCNGCLNNSMGQRDHMDCNTGCLHDPKMCYLCSD